MTWRTFAIGCAACLVLGTGIGWRLHVPPAAPAVHLVEATHETAQLAQHVEEGPSRTTVTDYAPACLGPVQLVPGAVRLLPGQPVPGPERLVPGPERIVRISVTERGPVVTDTRVASEAEHRQELGVTPPPPALRLGWAVSAGLQLLPDHRLELGLERRLFGPLWARASLLQPATFTTPAVIVGLRMEF